MCHTDIPAKKTSHYSSLSLFFSAISFTLGVKKKILLTPPRKLMRPLGFYFFTKITQGLSSYLNLNPRTPIALNGSIATTLYIHAQTHTKEQREWKTEGKSERISIHTVDSATWSKATGREGETRALKMVLQLILWVLAVTLSKYTHTRTHACSALSYLTKGRARRVSHSNRGTCSFRSFEERRLCFLLVVWHRVSGGWEIVSLLS